MAITARAKFHGHELTDVPVLNAGGWFGKTWLVEIGGSYWPLFLIVEADSEVLQVSWTVQCLIFGAGVGFQIGLGRRTPATNANARRCSNGCNWTAPAALRRSSDTRPVPVPF